MRIETIHKKQITFVFKNIIGGVATMNFGIIEQAQLYKYFEVRVILITKELDNANRINLFGNNLEIEIFKYSDFDNYHYVLSSLKELIDLKIGYLVTNDGLELDCIKYLGTDQVVLNIVHDLYNLKVALNYSEVIDYFICHTVEISSLLRSDPDLKKYVSYLPYGVEVSNNILKSNSTLKIVSLSRLVEAKGVLKLIKIENELLKMGIYVEWLILGGGPSKTDLLKQWKYKTNVSFMQPNNDELKLILSDSDIFISLSEFEGYGISLLEAMSFGLVPIITKLPIGIHSLLPSNCGMVVEQVNFREIADFIANLGLNKSYLMKLKIKSKEFVEETYSSNHTGLEYAKFFSKELLKRTEGTKKDRISNFGLFDKRYIPNSLTYFFKRTKFGIIENFKKVQKKI
ncbi:MAG: glycosyltransferase family 4 protein [Flavobacteriia bacterium]